MKLRAWAASLILGAGLIAGCGSDQISGIPFEPLFGTWDAVMFNGEPLPMRQTFQQGSLTCHVETTELALTFDNAGRFTSTDVTMMQCGENAPQNVSDPMTGTYRVSNDRLFLRASGRQEQSTLFTLDDDVLVISVYDAQGNQFPVELHRRGS
jgi:hypothetical protein